MAGYPRDTFANLGQHGAGEPGGGEEAGLRPIHEVQAPAPKVRW